jgi:predicted MFS family arabinose efflux permease
MGAIWLRSLQMLDRVDEKPNRRLVVSVLGCGQILSWGSTFYLLAVLAPAIVHDTGWSYDWVISGVSVGLLVAGAVSPWLGRIIGQRGGRLVLAGGSLLMATGLAILGATQNFVWYLVAWLLMGCGMGAGLYDAAFSTLGSIYGKESRGAITSVTLFGGFASTVCWPISALLTEHFGWQGTCFLYAAVHVGLAIPIYLLILPARSFLAALATGDDKGMPSIALERQEVRIFAVLTIVVTIAAAILSMMGNLVLQLLQARGFELAAAVALAALIGPSAVGARIVESFAGHRYHPIWTMVASATLVAAGILLFLLHFSNVGIAIVLYAAGNGIGSIARGTLPLALFGPRRYPQLMGRLGLPIMVAMAVAPFAGARAFQLGGADWTLGMLAFLATFNVPLVILLWRDSRLLRGSRTLGAPRQLQPAPGTPGRTSHRDNAPPP